MWQSEDNSVGFLLSLLLDSGTQAYVVPTLEEPPLHHFIFLKFILLCNLGTSVNESGNIWLYYNLLFLFIIILIFICIIYVPVLMSFPLVRLEADTSASLTQHQLASETGHCSVRSV